jgi:hypothetical protein
LDAKRALDAWVALDALWASGALEALGTAKEACVEPHRPCPDPQIRGGQIEDSVSQLWCGKIIIKVTLRVVGTTRTWVSGIDIGHIADNLHRDEGLALALNALETLGALWALDSCFDFRNALHPINELLDEEFCVIGPNEDFAKLHICDGRDIPLIKAVFV